MAPIAPTTPEEETPRTSPVFLLALTALCAVCGVGGYLLDRNTQHTFAVVLFVIAYISGGWAPSRELLNAISERRLDVNFLMIFAAIGAAAIGKWEEGITLLFLFSLSGAMEKFTLERTARSIEALIELRPDTATVLRDGTEVRLPIGEIRAGDRVRVGPGERLAVDGQVVEGGTNIDQSTITGESMPVRKDPGDDVFAGTLNQQGSIVVRVSRPANESTLSKIVETVRQAQDAKADTERFIHGWEKPYVIGVLALSASVAAYHMIFPGPDVLPAAVVGHAIYHAMVLLVAASPCAVVIATPSATLAGIIRAARSGILFKAGAHLEKLADIQVLAFDKTGTLTEGKPSLLTVWTDDSDGTAIGGSLTPQQQRLLQLAASVEQRSEHPLAQAVVSAARKRGIDLLDVTNFESHTAEGVHADFNGVWIGVGKPELFKSHNRPLPASVAQHAETLRARGETALVVAAASGECGVVGVADALRKEAVAVVAQARKMGIRHVMLLTGDHPLVAESVATTVNCDVVRAGLLPADKVMELRRAARQFGPVAMIGDGVNDAPALAAADLGIAMGGGGTDVALETADIVLMKNDLHGVTTALWLAQRTRAAVRRGLLFSFSVIAVLVLSSFLGKLELPWAVVGHEGSTVLTILSGLLVLVERAPKDSEAPA